MAFVIKSKWIIMWNMIISMRNGKYGLHWCFNYELKLSTQFSFWMWIFWAFIACNAGMLTPYCFVQHLHALTHSRHSFKKNLCTTQHRDCRWCAKFQTYSDTQQDSFCTSLEALQSRLLPWMSKPGQSWRQRLVGSAVADVADPA